MLENNNEAHLYIQLMQMCIRWYIDLPYDISAFQIGVELLQCKLFCKMIFLTQEKVNSVIILKYSFSNLSFTVFSRLI